MSAHETGGPAFPSKRRVDAGANGTITVDASGMTLRDYFAAKAMAALMGTAAGPCLGGLDGFEPHTAKAAYCMADAMLAARGDA